MQPPAQSMVPSHLRRGERPAAIGPTWRAEPRKRPVHPRIAALVDESTGKNAGAALAAPKTAIDDLRFAQCWSLDETGNWGNFREDDTGDGQWDLVQERASNPANEITVVNNLAGPAWATPAYDRAGNMTTVPKPADPSNAFTATYDAWNRLVKMAADSDTAAEYQYDGRKRRIVTREYVAGVLDRTRHHYFTSDWQEVEERIDTSTAAARQYVWGLRYLDDLVLRDRDTDADGTLDERLFGLQDANWNMAGVMQRCDP